MPMPAMKTAIVTMRETRSARCMGPQLVLLLFRVNFDLYTHGGGQPVIYMSIGTGTGPRIGFQKGL